MDKKVTVKTIAIQYGDAQIKAKMMVIGADRDDNTLTNFHSHKQYECHFIEKGNVEIHTEDQIVLLSQGEMLIIPPNKGHFATIVNDTFKRHVLGFSLSRVESEDKGIYAFFKEIFEKAETKPVKITPKLINLIKKFDAASVLNANDYVNSVTLLTNIVAGMVDALKLYHQSMSAIEGMLDWEMLLDTCINIPEMTLNDMASTMSYSRRHISRKIHEIYGMSLSDLRNHRKIHAAKKMLESTDDTIEQVASASGFKSAGAMREIFKKYEDITPTEYRKNKTN